MGSRFFNTFIFRNFRSISRTKSRSLYQFPTVKHFTVTLDSLTPIAFQPIFVSLNWRFKKTGFHCKKLFFCLMLRSFVYNYSIHRTKHGDKRNVAFNFSSLCKPKLIAALYVSVCKLSSSCRHTKHETKLTPGGKVN